MAAKVKLNSAGIQEYLDGEHGVRDVLRSAAERGAESMRASAPVASGEYRDSIEVWEDHTDRLVVRYGSRAPHALVVEANHGTAARSLDSAR